MKQAKHTPLPWIDNEKTGDIYSSVGFDPIGTATHGNKKANAAFIVRACNSHYELLELAKDAVMFLSAAHMDGKLTADLKAAIAKAEGQ